MRNEITAAVLFLVRLMEKNDKFHPDQVERFGRCLIKLLMERFENHWFPEKPFKGQGYRCIRVNGHSRRDSTLESAARAAGVKYEDLSLPVELTLWVDPREVCCRFGESKGSYCTLASFRGENESNDLKSDKENCAPNEQGSRQSQICLTTITTVADVTLNTGNKDAGATQGESHKCNKSAALGSSVQNQQQRANNSTAMTTGRRGGYLNSSRLPHSSRNRSRSNYSFSMGVGSHPAMNQPPRYIQHPHFLGGPSPPPFGGRRTSKWIHPSSYPASEFIRYSQWSTNNLRATLKV